MMTQTSTVILSSSV